MFHTVFCLTTEVSENSAKDASLFKNPMSNMTRKLDKIFFVAVILGGCAIVAMWVLGFNGHNDAAAGSLVFAGIASFVGVVAKGLAALRRYNGAFD